MNDQEQFIANLLELYNGWAALGEHPVAISIYKKAGESKTCPQEHFRIILGPTMGGDEFFRNIGISIKKGSVKEEGKPGLQTLVAINCEDIEAFSEEKKQEIINKAKLFIEMEKMKAYLGKCNSFRVFGFEVVMKAEGKLGVCLGFGCDEWGIISQIDECLSTVSSVERVNKTTSFNESGKPQSYNYEFEVDNSVLVKHLAERMEPIIAELAALQFMGSIVRAYNQIAEHNGQQAMIYQSKKQTEAGGCSIKKYFVMPANENWANFLQKIELPLVKIHSKDSYEHILDYDSISEKTRSDRYRCIAWANAKAAEICGKKGQLRPESVLAVASASLGAGGSGGAAAGGAAYAAFDGPQ